MTMRSDRTHVHGSDVAIAAEPSALDGMLALSPDAILLVDAGGSITAVNQLAEELLGFVAADLVGHPIEVLVPDEVRPGHRAKRDSYLARPVQHRMGSRQVLHARRQDGSNFPADISLQPVVVHGAQVTVVAVRDLTPQQHLERRNTELEEYAGSLRRFADVASHELRTPLAAIRGFAETLQRPGLAPVDQRAALDGLIRNARRQEALFDDLLDLSRLQHAAMGPDLQAVAVAAVARQVIDGVDGLDVDLDLDRLADTQVLADPRLLGQILHNLLANAVHYGSPPISLEATTAPAAGVPNVAIAVRDHGPGIAADFEPRLFSPFTQQSNGDAREAVGLGLGLHLSREWATVMGGSLDYRPNQPVGACFELRLPTTSAAASGPTTTRSPGRDADPAG